MLVICINAPLPVGLITSKTSKFLHEQLQSFDWVCLFLWLSSSLWFTPPGILIVPFVVLFCFLVLISTYVLVSSCWSTSCWNSVFLYEEAAALHHSCRSREQSGQVPCSCASPLCRARLWTSPFMSPQPKVQPLCFWFSATSTAAANRCWATGISEERSSPFFSGAGAPPVLSTDHELPKLRPPFASVLQQQFIGCSFSTFYQFFCFLPNVSLLNPTEDFSVTSTLKVIPIRLLSNERFWSLSQLPFLCLRLKA